MEEKKEVEGTEQNYIEQIQKLKENTVSKEHYEKVIKENKQLTEALVNGGSIPGKEEKEENIEELAKNLKKDQTNLEYIDNALKYRKAVLDKYDVDVFVAFNNPQETPTGEDYERAERVAEKLQAAVDYADGDSDVFNSEYQRIVTDTGMQKIKK